LKDRPVPKAALLIALGLGAIPSVAFAEIGTVMPAVFEQGIVFVDMPAPDHSKVRMFTDSGGPTAFTLSAETAARLKLQLHTTRNEALLGWLGPNVRVASASKYMREHWRPLHPAQRFVINPGAPGFQGYPPTADGTFGEAWFAHHIWTWDYPRAQLILRPENWRPPPDAHEFTVSFQTDAAGHRTFNYPRMMIRVDGAELAVLFDTGADTVLTPNALNALADGKPAQRSTSLIAHSVFEGWHQRHAEWRILDDAQLKTHSRMILVDNVEVAGSSVGAVWFTERDDETIHGIRSSSMSGQVEGSIGPNAFADFVISVDYPSSRAWMQTKASRH
jgi:hypothetical protein